jgi:hypothetical protein
VGSGGPGGGKVFWLPYTSSDPEKSRKATQDGMCDNCKTLTHEAQHGIGSNVEFDSFSDVVGIGARMERFPKGERLESDIRTMGYSLMGACKKQPHTRYLRGARNRLCALNARYPNQVREALTHDAYFTDEQAADILRCACKQDKGQ